MQSVNKESILDDIIDYVKRNCSFRDVEIHANTSLIAEGVVDSMTIIQLILYVENKYHVNFNEDDMLFDEMTNPLGFAGITFEKIGKV